MNHCLLFALWGEVLMVVGLGRVVVLVVAGCLLVPVPGLLGSLSSLGSLGVARAASAPVRRATQRVVVFPVVGLALGRGASVASSVSAEMSQAVRDALADAEGVRLKRGKLSRGLRQDLSSNRMGAAQRRALVKAGRSYRADWVMVLGMGPRGNLYAVGGAAGEVASGNWYALRAVSPDRDMLSAPVEAYTLVERLRGIWRGNGELVGGGAAVALVPGLKKRSVAAAAVAGAGGVGGAAGAAGAAGVGARVRAPVGVGRVPVSASRAPVSASRVPVSASRAPVAASRRPAVASRAPVSASRVPASASRAPVVASRRPAVASRVPSRRSAAARSPSSSSSSSVPVVKSSKALSRGPVAALASVPVGASTGASGALALGLGAGVAGAGRQPLPALSATDLDLGVRADGAVDSGERPFWKKWWFWTIVGAGAAAVAGGTTWGVLAAQNGGGDRVRVETVW